MSEEALRLAVSQEKLNKTIKRSGPESTAAKQATLNYRREVAALASSQTQAVHASTQHVGVLDQEQRSLGRVARGALAGSGAIRGFGRSVAFASSAFLGGAGLVYAIESTVKAAENSEKVLGQTENAVTRAGLSWDRYGDQIRKAALEQSHISGFDDERLLGTFSKFVRSTKDVNEALRLNALASNVARGADIELEQAAKIVLRAHVGQARGLAVLGIEARKGATGVELINQITQKYANSAQAYGDKAVGAQDRIRVAIENTQEVVAQDYLPTIAKQLNQGADWLNQAENQKRIQRDVAEVMHTGAEVVHGLGEAYDVLAPILRTAIRLLGGTKDATEILLAVYAGVKVRKALLALGLIKTATRAVGTAAVVAEAQTSTAMTGIAAAEAKTGAAAATSATKVGRLRGALTGLNAISVAPIVVPIVIDVATRVNSKVEGALGPLGKPYDIVQYLASGGAVGTNPVTAVIDALFGHDKKPATYPDAKNVTAEDKLNPRRNVPGSPAYVPPPEAAGANTRPRLDRLSRINLAVSNAQVAISRGDNGAQQQLIAALKEQIDYDRDYEAKQERLLKSDPAHARQHATILQGLYAEEQSARDQIASIEQQNAQKAKDAADRAARARAKAKSEREAAERKRAKDYRDGLALREQRLKNDVAAAKLTTDTIADDKSAYAKLIAFDRVQERNVKLTAREHESYHAKELAARKQLADLSKKKSGGGFQEFAQAAADEFRTYGSNIAGINGVLSTQDERARAAENLLKEIRNELRQQNRHGGETAAATKTLARNGHRPIDDARYAATHGW